MDIVEPEKHPVVILSGYCPSSFMAGTFSSNLQTLCKAFIIMLTSRQIYSSMESLRERDSQFSFCEIEVIVTCSESLN